jgi:uncharacterized membrane protein
LIFRNIKGILENIMDIAQIILVILMAISLSACAGIRAFLPPLAVSLLALGGYITLAPQFQWMARWDVALVFGIAAVLEIVADKYPGVDNLLDGAGLVVKPLAGALLASSVITGMDPLLALTLGIIVGGGVAGTVHLAKAKLRLASTAFTGGLANPVVSFFEDAFAVIGTALAVVWPVLVAIVLAVLGFFGWRLIRGRRTMHHSEV